ncbi:unnamed protein product, partial [marine sediment metagenome]
DEWGAIKSIGTILKFTYPKCELKFGVNGKELLKYASEADYDLIITDNGMPIMNGLDATKN